MKKMLLKKYDSGDNNLPYSSNKIDILSKT